MFSVLERQKSRDFIGMYEMYENLMRFHIGFDLISRCSVKKKYCFFGSKFVSFRVLDDPCHSIYIRKVSFQHLLSALLNCFQLVYGSFGQNNLHCRLNFCPDKAISISFNCTGLSVVLNMVVS